MDDGKKYYRSMPVADDGLPLLDDRGLGVRVGDGQYDDIRQDSDGFVEPSPPGTRKPAGMSANERIDDIFVKYLPESHGGRCKDPKRFVFELDPNDIPAELNLRPDEINGKPDPGHFVLEPRTGCLQPSIENC